MADEKAAMKRPPARLHLPALPFNPSGPRGRLPEHPMTSYAPSSPRPLRQPISILYALTLTMTSTGCFNPLVTLDTDDENTDGDTDTATADGSTTDSPTTSEPDGGSEDGPTPVCGNGVVEGNELCDDGVNDGSYGGCNADCTAPGPFCGDGVLNGEEPCDDGDDVDGNGCNVDCVVSGTVLWTVTYDGPQHGIDSGHGVTTDSASNVIVSGGLDLGDESVGWLRKYSPDGASQWTFEVTAPTGPARNGPVAAMLDDDVVFGGNYATGDASRDAWVWRVSSVGEAVWTETYASAQGGWDIVAGLDVDQAGNVYVLFEETQLPAEPFYRTFVRKYTPDGDELWTQFHDAGIHGQALSVDTQGRLIVVGTQNDGANDEIWIQQSDSDGAELWNQILGAGEASHAIALSVNDEGDIAVLAEPSVRVVRLTSDGEQLDTVFPHPEEFLVAVFSVHLDNHDNLFVGGTTVTRNEAAYGWVTKYHPDGSEIWTNIHDGEFDRSVSFDSVLAMTTDQRGNVIATGRIHDAASSLSNIWISKYAP